MSEIGHPADLLAICDDEGVCHQLIQRGCTSNCVIHESCLQEVMQAIANYCARQGVVAEHVCQFPICKAFWLKIWRIPACDNLDVAKL